MADGSKKKNRSGKGECSCETGKGECSCETGKGECSKAPGAGPTVPDHVAERLSELQRTLGAMSTALDAFEGMLGLTERVAEKSRDIAAMSERWATWSPLTLLNSSAIVSKRGLLEECQRLSSEMARLGAEYNLLMSEKRERESENG